MIWSVSTSERSSTDTGPLIFVTGSMSVPLPDVDEVALDRRGRGHLRRDEVRAPAAPLAALEVAVARGRAALAGRKRVRVHPEAHRAAGAAPVEPGGAEDLVEALLLGLGLHLLRARHDHRVHAARDPAALDHGGRGAEVAYARVRARADEDAVELDLLDRRPGPEVHVAQRTLLALRLRLRHLTRHRRDHPGRRAPRDLRRQRARVDLDLLVEARALVGPQIAPLVGDLVRRRGAAAEPLEGGLVGGDHARPAAALDRHVADGHAALHRELLDRLPRATAPRCRRP